MTEMESSKESCDKAMFYRKMNALRSDILLQDWSDDKAIRMSGSVVPYLSTDKIKKTMAPLFAKHKIEIRMEFEDLEFREPIGSQMHCTIRLKATTIDIDSGYSDTSDAYGEACDFGDKAVSKAQTYALKNWMMSQFLVADGIDPDTLNAVASNGGNFYKKSPEEQEEVVSKVLGQGVPIKKESEPKISAFPTPAKEKEPAKPASASKPVPDVKEKAASAKEMTKTDKAKENTASINGAEKVEGNLYNPPGPQGLAVNRIVSVWEGRAKAGEVTPEEYNAMSAARVAMSSPVDAAKFITKYNVSDIHAH